MLLLAPTRTAAVPSLPSHQAVVTSEGTAIADVLADISKTLRAIAHALKDAFGGGKRK